MSKLSEAEIFRYCIQAGFTPDQAVTMTAISLAESSGETGAHVTPDAGTQEDSVGLFQINRLAHDWSYNMDLTDPVQNAQAAFKVSGGGADISPWTVTHRSNGTPYSKNRARALQAAADNGYSNLTGYFDGVSGYGNSHGASTLPNGGPAATTSPFDLFAPAGGGAGAGRNAVLSGDLANAPSGTVERFVGLALAQAGDRYILGAEADASDPNPKAFSAT